MSAIHRRLAERFTHPRLAVTFLLGVVILAVGIGLSTVAPPASDLAVTGFRLLVIGYVVALVGGAGYLAFLAFELRDRQLR